MVENVVDDGVEPKPAIIKASIEAPIDVKPTIEVLVNVKIFIQASVEVKPIGVSKLRDNEVNTTSFFFTNDRG